MYVLACESFSCLFCIQLHHFTFLEGLLFVMGILCAAANSAMIPLTIFSVGHLVELFPAYDHLTPVAFEFLGTNLSELFVNFTFDQDASISSIPEALTLMTLNPTVISTQDQFTTLLINIFSSVSNDTTVVETLSSEYSCVVYQYANDTNSTGYLTLQSIVENDLFNREVSPALNITVEQCNCLELTLQVYSTGVPCLATQSFLYGNQTFDDGGVVKEILALFILSFSTLILAFFQVFLTQASTDSWIHRVRLVYYQAVLRQNIGWFDFNLSNVLANRLEE